MAVVFLCLALVGRHVPGRQREPSQRLGDQEGSLPDELPIS
jgi:hypothetical protein